MSSTAICDAVVFDVGGTLLHVTHDPQARALQRIASLGPVSLEAFRAGVKDAIDDWRGAGGLASHEDLPDTWMRHYERGLTTARFSGDCAAAARLIEEAFLVDGWEVFPDAVPILERLRARGVTLGIISNWPATLEATLERAGLRDYFSVVVASGCVGYTKPHPEIFRIAITHLGLDPPRALYVGDSVEHDLLGATGVGLQAVLLDREGKHEGDAPSIKSLAALETLLDAAPTFE